MNINAVSSLVREQTITSIEQSKPVDHSFSGWLSDKILDTNNQLNAADKALTELAAGTVDNLHQAMLTMEEAKLSFQYLEQIRNRLMSAYQDLLREQI
ncbi:MAG: flagellar hook-basal body complex protein FliE [Legionella sp.]